MRCKRSLLHIFLFFSLITILIFISALLRDYLQFKPQKVFVIPPRYYHYPDYGGRISTEGTFSLALSKHVTKSLTELGRMEEVNRHFLFFNRVPRSGSEVLILLLQRLQGYNNFRHVRLKWGNKRFLTKIQQEELVDEIYEIMKNEAVPLSFDRHVYFINFTTFDKQLPMYINLVRNPVDMVISRTSFGKNTTKLDDDFYFKCLLSVEGNCSFKNGKPYDFSIPYFCGQHPNCMLLNNEWAYQEAKNNVDKYYKVVGVLENLNATLHVLEQKIPFFFKGVSKTYIKYFYKIHKNQRVHKGPNGVRSKLEKSLVKELDFYYWIKSKLLRQYHILRS